MNFEFSALPPIFQAFLATMFTWAVTALGAGVVFFKEDINRKVLDASLGFAAGIMIAASFWSLLLPSIQLSSGGRLPAWFPATVGFLSGGFFLRLLDKFIPHLHLNMPQEKAEGIKSNLRKTTLLMLAITIHNFPEGLAIGVAFGSIASAKTVSLSGAIALAIGIAIQNFPEGMAVSLPLRREGLSKIRSFWYGQLSALVEPLGGILGAGLVILSKPILPYALSFAAGAMMFVVIEELIPESQSGENADMATIGALIGFAVMMVLDVAFG
ncbi:MAG: ZIP family metal transporter [Candidatus Hydrothermarchaeota archaeon]|nr:MAG: ZIP family metal transporter [Candidatus Hydrothermarchaeota archaeon]